MEASVESSVIVVWPRGAENSIPQVRWLSVALATRLIETLKSSEVRFGWRRGCYNNDWTEDVNYTSGVQRVWVESGVRDTDWANEKKPLSAHDDDRSDLV